MNSKINKLLGGIALTFAGLIPLSASAGLLTFDGATFSSSWAGDILTIEIDAAPSHLTGGWAAATKISAIAINDVGSITSASDVSLDAPGTSFDGDIEGWGLSASNTSCQSTDSTSYNHACWWGSETLTDNMMFNFTFASSVANHTDTPHLKVRFLDANNDKVGSLLSMDLPSVNVPEPGTLALFGLGLVVLVGVRRKHA